MTASPIVIVPKGRAMHHAFRILPAFLAVGVLTTSADAVPRLYAPPTSAPYAIQLGCTIRLAKRPVTEHKLLSSYLVSVVDTLDHPLAGGTAVQYGVAFPDGTTQNGTTSLGAPVASGSAEVVGIVATPPFAPASCTAGVPRPQAYAPPGGGGGYIPISSSPKPVLHAI